MIGQTISHYTILAKLGEGGMGVVYKAHDTTLDRDVALKFLPSEYSASSEEQSRFLREAKAASALDHPNICTIYEAGQSPDGRMFIAMGYYEGVTLGKKIENGHLEVGEAISLAMQIAEGLAAAHEKGIIHRDIKSSNILVTDRGQVKILDFGLAHRSGFSKLTKTGSTVGTTAYMSPEQLRGEKVDPRTDIWSLGVVMYELLTSSLPFPAEFDAAIMYAILHEVPKPLTSHRTDVPLELEKIINKCLSRETAGRYKDIGVFRSDLAAVKAAMLAGTLKEHPVQAIMYHVGRLLRRKKIAYALALLVIGGTLFTLLDRDDGIHSLAVLPFKNVGGDSSLEYLSDGITESLINGFAQLPNLKVMSRNSVFTYKGKDVNPSRAGRDLGVRAILTGKVLQRGDQLIVNADFIDAASNAQIWGEQYMRSVADIISLQIDIGEKILRELRLKLTPEESNKATKQYTADPEAYRLFLRGLHQWNRFDELGYRTGIEYFKKAIDADPSYALAYAGLSQCYYGMSGSYATAGTAIPKAKSAAVKAIALDETIAEAHGILAVITSFYDKDWRAGEAQFKTAISLNPNNASLRQLYSWYLMVVGRLDEALVQAKSAFELDPLTPLMQANIAWVYYMKGDYEMSVNESKKMLEFDTTIAVTRLNLGQSYVQLGRYREAIAELEACLRLDPANSVAIGILGHAHAVAGNRSAALRTIDRLDSLSKTRFVSPMAYAAVHAGLANGDLAMGWLENASEQQIEDVLLLNVDPKFTSLKSNPRFKALVRRMGLQ